jgi:hypothetical protein
MLAYYGHVLTKWWFWVTLPIAFAIMFALDGRLSSYSSRYWRDRGKEQPPHRTSYLDAGRFVLYAVVAGIVSVVELFRGQLLWGAIAAGAMVVFGWLVLWQARRNVI